MNAGFDYREWVGSGAAGSTLLIYLTRHYRHSPEADWRDRIDSGLVLLDGAPARPDTILRGGQSITWCRPAWQEPPAPLSFAVLHEDEDLLAVLKPSGLPTLPGGGFLDHTLLTLVRRRNPEASPMHRLGRGTSGVVLFTRTPRASRALATLWRDGKVLKVYRALASGHPERDEFPIDVPIGRVPHPLLGSVHAACREGKPSMSQVRVLERRTVISLVQVTIATGRPHQIRIHLAAAGYPLVGDPLYGAGGLPRKGTEALPGDPGYLLHAERLGFLHPVTGTFLGIEAPPPLALRDSRGH